MRKIGEKKFKRDYRTRIMLFEVLCYVRQKCWLGEADKGINSVELFKMDNWIRQKHVYVHSVGADKEGRNVDRAR